MPKQSSALKDLKRIANALDLDPDSLIAETRHLLDGYRHLKWFAEYCPNGAEACKALDRLPTLFELDGFAPYRHYVNEPTLLAQLKHDCVTEDPLFHAVEDTTHFPEYGTLYHHILNASYLEPECLTDRVLNESLHIERSTYYSRKAEAVLCCGIAFYQRLRADHLTLCAPE